MRDTQATKLFPVQKYIQGAVLVVLLLIFGSATLMIYSAPISLMFSPLIELIVENLFSSQPQPWVLGLTLLLLGVLALALLLVALFALAWLERRVPQPRSSISVTLPPPPADPEQGQI